ncbi:MAG: class I SAM-dependent methyltransferase [Bacilli bacterium]|nr:class I SAM-dependent methyltransferase [Bacilli bacterium]
MNKDYETLAAFWDAAFQDDGFEQAFPLENPEELAPSPKLAEALKGFRDCKRVLDYGCGNGWASIIMARSGAKDITSVDVSPNAITLLQKTATAFSCADRIEGEVISPDWLCGVESDTFDGLFSSNVLDVVPLEMAEKIIEECARVCKSGARVVFSFNFYMDPETMAKRGFEVRGRNVYSQGVLRLVALQDDEWKQRFDGHFVVESLDYFAWPGEAKETRRLFVLRKV